MLVPKNTGYGYGILQGLKEAKGDFLGWMHADMQTDPQDIIRAYKILEKNNWNKNMYVKGKRKKRSFVENFFTIGMSIFETIYLREFLWDINGQPNVFSRKFYRTWIEPPKDFSFDLYVLYMGKKQKLDFKRINVLFPNRINGVSSWNTGLLSKWKLIKRIIKYSIELNKKGIK